jgi:hypothetical protein
MADEIAALAKTLRGIRKDVTSLDSRLDDAETKLGTLSAPVTPPKEGVDDDGNPFK